MKERRYNVWSGNPKGNKEDQARCIVEVQDSAGWFSYQCTRKRGKGPNGEYCGIHAGILAKGHRVCVPEPREAK